MAMAEAISYGLEVFVDNMPLYDELFADVTKDNICDKFNWEESAFRENKILCEVSRK